MTATRPVIRDHRALRLAGWLVVGLYVFWFLRAISTRVLWSHYDTHDDFDVVLAWFQWMQWFGLATPVLEGLLAWALLRARRATGSAGLRAALLVGAVALALQVIQTVAWFVASVAESQILSGAAFAVVALSLNLLSTVAVALALLVHARRLEEGTQVVLAAIALAFGASETIVHLLRRFAPALFSDGDPFGWSDLLSLTLTFGTGALTAAAALRAGASERRIAQASPESTVARTAPALAPEEAAAWTPALAGLRLYRGGLLAKIGFLVFGMAIVVTGSLSSSLGTVKAGMLFAALTGTAASVAMYVGLLRFAGVPRETGAADTVFAAVLLMSFGLLTEAWALVETFRLIDARGWDVAEIVERMRYIDLVAQAVGLVALLVLLGALARTAQWLGVHEVAERVGGVRGLILVVVPFAVALRFESVIRALGGPALLLVALLVLGMAITMITLYVGLLGRVIRAIEAHIRTPSAPVAGAPETFRSFDPVI